MKNIRQPSLAGKKAVRQEMLNFANSFIFSWRCQRQQLADSLCHCLTRHLLQTTTPNKDDELEELCSKLIDYVSTGHFDVYAKILRATAQQHPEHQHLLRTLHRYIGSSTDQVLRFNEKYDVEKPLRQDSRILSDELYKLAKALSIRFVLEEQLLEASGICSHCT